MKLEEMSRDGLADRIEKLEVERQKLKNHIAELEAALSECVKAMTAITARAVNLIAK